MAGGGVGAVLDCRRAVFWVVAGAWLVARVETSAPAVKTMPPELAEEFCKNFTYGDPDTRYN